MDKLTATEIADALVALPGWTVQDGKLHREYRFPDFASRHGIHDDRRARDRALESPSRMVERL